MLPPGGVAAHFRSLFGADPPDDLIDPGLAGTRQQIPWQCQLLNEGKPISRGKHVVQRCRTCVILNCMEPCRTIRINQRCLHQHDRFRLKPIRNAGKKAFQEALPLGAYKPRHLLAGRTKYLVVATPEKDSLQHRRDGLPARAQLRRDPTRKCTPVSPLHPAKIELAQNLRAMAPPRATRKIVPFKIGLADAKLIGQIRNRLVGNLSRRRGKISVRDKELQLRRQPKPRPHWFGIHKIDVGKRQAPFPRQLSRRNTQTHKSTPCPGADFQARKPWRSIRSRSVPQLGQNHSVEPIRPSPSTGARRPRAPRNPAAGAACRARTATENSWSSHRCTARPAAGYAAPKR